MAKTSKIVRNQKRVQKVENARAAGTPAKFKCRVRNRCNVCGRPRGFIRLLGLCRQCARKLARDGEIAGLRKSSW